MSQQMYACDERISAWGAQSLPALYYYHFYGNNSHIDRVSLSYFLLEMREKQWRWELFCNNIYIWETEKLLIAYIFNFSMYIYPPFRLASTRTVRDRWGTALFWVRVKMSPSTKKNIHTCRLSVALSFYLATSKIFSFRSRKKNANNTIE